MFLVGCLEGPSATFTVQTVPGVCALKVSACYAKLSVRVKQEWASNKSEIFTSHNVC
jgi:precorrin-2 methylase